MTMRVDIGLVKRDVSELVNRMAYQGKFVFNSSGWMFLGGGRRKCTN
jgi:hypothetical protein